jgi:hypothetical protein
LDKAKEMNGKIWQETHPEEFKKQQLVEQQKKDQEEKYAAEV